MHCVRALQNHRQYGMYDWVKGMTAETLVIHCSQHIQGCGGEESCVCLGKGTCKLSTDTKYHEFLNES